MVEEDQPNTKNRVTNHERAVVQSFFLHIEKQKVRVCKMFFMSTLDISPTTIAIPSLALQKLIAEENTLHPQK